MRALVILRLKLGVAHPPDFILDRLAELAIGHECSFSRRRRVAAADVEDEHSRTTGHNSQDRFDPEAFRCTLIQLIETAQRLPRMLERKYEVAAGRQSVERMQAILERRHDTEVSASAA